MTASTPRSTLRLTRLAVRCGVLLAALVTARGALAAERVLRVYKSERRMVLEVDGQPVHTFRIALGGAPIGDKARQGDQRTPEGELYIAWKNAGSSFHRFLGLSYPMPHHAASATERGMISREERRRIDRAARSRGIPPQQTKLGGYVGIHGGGAGLDWTLGCIAVSDEEIELLFEKLRTGDRVVVLP